METGVLFFPRFPFPTQYINEIIRQLESNNPFVILGIDDERKKYSLFDFSYSQEILESKFVVHLDRNIVSYCYQFLRRETRTIESQKFALSALIYLNMFEARYDLSQSLLEVFQSTSEPNRLQSEISTWNLLIDTLHSSAIRYALDLILFGRNDLPIGYESRKVPVRVNASGLEPDIFWYSSYIHLLKLATIQKRNLPPCDAIKVYLDWITNFYKSDTAAVYFSMLFFSEREKFKTIHGDLSIIRNLSWDLSHITNWFQKSREHIEDSKVHDVLVTNDRRLKEIANCLSRSVLYHSDSDPVFLALLNKYYSSASISRISILFDSFMKELKKNGRPRNSFNDIELKKVIISGLEDELTRQ